MAKAKTKAKTKTTAKAKAKTKTTAKTKDVPPRFRGERVVFAGTIEWQEEAAKAVAAEGGKVQAKLDAKTTIVVLGLNAKTVQDSATQLNKQGKATIRLLSEKNFLALLKPSRDESLVLLRQGPKGVKRWQRLVLADFFSIDGLITVDLTGASLARASLAKAVLTACKLDRVDFRGADLNSADIGVDIKGANFEGAALVKANIGELKDCKLKSANLSGAFIANGALGCDFTNANLSKLGGSYAELKGSTFRNANLEKADLEEAKLANADLRDANLTGAKLLGADLRKAKLAGARLAAADLGNANLSGADLSNASFAKATLTTANLSGAKLTGANFDGAKVSGAKLPKLAAGSPNIATTNAKIGPSLRELQRIVKKTRKIKMELKIDLATGGRAELTASVDRYGWVALEGNRFKGRAKESHVEKDCFSDNETDHKLAAGLSKLANRYADDKPTITEVNVTARECSLVDPALTTLVTKAWSEVLGIA
jgi:uncharacterized protein YjbI with pentapeptide repeats